MPDLSALTRTLAALLPEGCGCGAANPLAAPDGLLPGEAAQGIDKRQREFAAGRRAARQAMAQIGQPPLAVPMGEDRAPIWPAGLAGSITHSATACLAVVTARPLLIGLDMDPDSALSPELWQTVLRPSEAAQLAGDGHQAMAIFCAKEAAYKAQFPRSRTLFDCQVLEVVLSGDRFTATFCTAIPGFDPGTVLNGRIAHTAGHILALVTTDQPRTA